MSQEDHVSGAWQAQQGSAEVLNGGVMLREAREAAGLSLDAVSAHLKLAPRQVKALEDGEFNLLPGRTFVRGFARNYARLLGLDPEAVLEALPGAAVSGGLEAPALHPTTGRMGELPSSGGARPQWMRWAIPVAVIAALAAAAAYEYLGSRSRKAPAAPASVSAPASEPAPEPVMAPAPTPVPPPAQTTPGRDGTTALPPPSVTTQSEAAVPSTSQAVTSPARVATPGEASSSTEAGSTAALEITSRGASWMQVRDSSGRTVVSQTLAAGQKQAVVGTPPFDVTIGNAPQVSVTYRRRVVDLAPHSRQNVAHLRLQ
ncbi:MAG: DUF4115 domain-containing protein [Pseudomonadota bacterium]|nr:DUF4115 domain-containing protein [Pseudomonadota bacterium]